MIQQIYCTHCTYGTSVLDQREGEWADRVLGYSARAASLDRNELRGYYRQIERFLSYYLPGDTPPEEKQRLDADSAPRRFFVCPSMGNLQVVGQVSYRPTDTAGRVGSYFAHVLFTSREPGAATHSAWSTLDGLRLWQAPWADHDSPELPLRLPALERLDDLWGGARPALDDELVLRFLQTPAGEPLDDPAQVVPARWHGVPAAERIDLLVNTLQGLLALGLPRRASVLLVAEPSVAALVFYGVARLLPAELLDGASFSTFEPTTERLPVTLAATTFFSPETSDVRPDLYRRGGPVLNTYTGRTSESGPPAGRYARFIVERLLADGWAHVDRLLESFQEAGAKRPEDLEVLAQTHGLVSHVLSAEPMEDGSWRSSNVAANYLRQEVRHQLAHAEPGWPELQTVAGSANHLQVLELVAGEAVPADLHGPAQFLLNKLPPEKYPELLASPRIASSAKLDALQSYVTRFGHLPEGCEPLWAEEAHPTLRPTADHRPLLERLFARLPEAVLVPLYESVPEAQRKPLLLTLQRACRAETRSQGALKQLVLRRLAELNDVQFIETIVEQRESLRACFTPPEPALAERLCRLLYELPSHPRHFQKWLAALELWVAYFPDPDLAERRLTDWRTIRQTLESLRDEGKPTASGRVEWLKSKFKAPAPRDLRTLAEALARAMRRRPAGLDELDDAIARSIITPEDVQKRLQLAARAAGFSMSAGVATVAAQVAERSDEPLRAGQQARMQSLLREFEQRALVYPDDERGSRRQTVLRNLGMEIVHRPDFLPPIFWTRLSRYFEYGDWDEVRGLGKSKRKQGRSSLAAAPAFGGPRRTKKLSKHLLVGIVAAAVVLAVGVGVEVVSRARRGSSTTPVPTGGAVAQRSAAGQAAANNTQAAGKPAAAKEPNGPRATTKPATKTPNASGKTPTSAPDATRATSDDDDAHVAVRSAKEADEKVNDTPTPATSNKSATPPQHDDEDPPSTPPPTKPGRPAPDSSPAKADTPADEPKLDREPASSGDADTPSDDVASSDDSADAEDAKAPAAPSITAQSPTASIPLLTSGKLAYETMYVWKWDAAPKKPTLVLLGLDFVNQHLDGPGKLDRPGKIVARDTDEGLDVALVRAADAAPVSLATLKATDKGLAFHWAKLAEEEHPARNCQEYLRRCVVKIESDEPSLYVALSQPSQVDPLELSKGLGKLNQHAVKKAAFKPLPDDELILGAGRISLKDNRSLPFGESPDAGPPYFIDRIPSDLVISEAEIQWSRDADDPTTWLIQVGMRDDLEVSAKKALLEKNERLSSKIGKASARIKKKIGDPMRSLDRKQTAAWDNRIAMLAKDIGRENVPNVPSSPDQTSMDTYWQQIKLLLDAAAKTVSELKQKNNQRTRELRAMQRKRSDASWQFTSSATSLSAVVYRRVDDDVQAMYLILGNPEPPEPDDAPARGRGDQ